MQRFYDFIRRHPTGVDILWAVLLLGFSGVSIVTDQIGAGPERVAAVPIAVGLSFVVALRRRVPERMLLLAIVMGLAQLVLGVRQIGRAHV